MIVHMKTKHPELSQPSRYLLAHETEMLHPPASNDDFAWRCTKCKRSFTYDGRLTNEDSGERPHYCPMCGKFVVKPNDC